MRYNVAEMRHRKGISQAELAKQSGTARGILSRLESGQPMSTTTATLSKIARVLGCTVAELLCEEERGAGDG